MMVEIALRSLGLMFFVALAALAFRNASAALRHRIWALGFVALAALPLLALRLPSLEIARPGVPSRERANFVRETNPSGPRPVEVPVSTGGTPAPSTRQEAETTDLWPDGLAVVYGLGVFFLLARTAFQILHAVAWIRQGERVPVAELPPRTRALRTPAVEVPMTLGFVRPAILLPLPAEAWPEPRLRAVLLHEAAHIRRGDWAWLVFARLVASLYWPNPLVHWAASRMRVEAELAADDLALQAGVDPSDYASTLVDLAAGLRGRPVGAALPFVEKGALKVRVAAILSGARQRPLGRRGALVAFLVGVAVVVPFAATRLVSAPWRFQKGRLDLGAEGWIEVAAITSIEGGKTVSWDVNGALLPQPYLVEEAARKWMENDPAPEGATVRYVFFRYALRDETMPVFQARPGKEPLATRDYLHVANSRYDIDDPLDADFRIVRLVLRPEETKGRMAVRLPSGDWEPYAQAEFRGGAKVRSSVTAASLKLTPAPAGSAWKSELAFTLPDDFGERDVSLVRTPSRPGGNIRWQGASGPQTGYLDLPVEAIRRLDFYVRPTRAVFLDDLPLAPRPGASRLARTGDPKGTIVAKDGQARLPDGSLLAFERTWDPRDPQARGWRADGRTIAERSSPPWMSDFPRDSIPGLRLRAFSVLQTGRADSSQVWAYDGDGLTAPMTSPAQWSTREESHLRFLAQAGAERRTMSVLLKTTASPYRQVAEGILGQTPGYRGFFRKGNYGLRTFAVEFPQNLLARMPGVDASLVPLDAAGREVHNADGSLGSSRQTSDGGENVIEYDLTPDRSRLVRRLALRVRPYVWVRFPEVRLDPK